MRRLMSCICIALLTLAVPSAGKAAGPHRAGPPGRTWTSVGDRQVRTPARARLYAEMRAHRSTTTELLASQRAALMAPRSEGGSEMKGRVSAEDLPTETYVITTADLDGNGAADVLVDRWVGGVDMLSARRGSDGTEMWSVPSQYPLVLTDDFDGDGAVDVLMLSITGVSGGVFKGTTEQRIDILDGKTGSTLYSVSYIATFAGAGTIGTAAVRYDDLLYAIYFSADMDGDGVKDFLFDTVSYRYVSAGIFAGASRDSATVTAHAVSGASGEQFASPATSGPFVAVCPVLCVEDGGFPDAVPIGDASGDGLGDVAMLSNTMRTQTLSTTSADGSAVYWQSSLKASEAFLLPLQLNGTGADDLLVLQFPKSLLGQITLTAVDGADGSTMWNSPPANAPSSFFGDVDGDGGMDFENFLFIDGEPLFAAQSGKTGALIWSAPYPPAETPPEGGSADQYVCGCPTDVSGDGVSDEFFYSGSYDADSAWISQSLTAVSGVDGSILWTISLPVDQAVPYPLGVDVTGDGTGDLATIADHTSDATVTYYNGGDGGPGGTVVHAITGQDHFESLIGANLDGAGPAEALLNVFEGTCEEFGCTFDAYVAAYGSGGFLWSI